MVLDNYNLLQRGAGEGVGEKLHSGQMEGRGGGILLKQKQKNWIYYFYSITYYFLIIFYCS